MCVYTCIDTRTYVYTHVYTLIYTNIYTYNRISDQPMTKPLARINNNSERFNQPTFKD